MRLESVLARTVPAEVTNLRLSGLSSAGNVMYGPQTRAKAAVVEFTGIPITVTRLLIEYLVDDQVIGLAELDVVLRENQVLVIEDPDFQDVGAILTALEITPSSARIAQGTQVALAVAGRRSDGSVSDVTGSVTWSASGSAASVSADGVVSGLQVGSSKVTARLGQLSADVEITVTAATVVSLQLTPSTPSVAVGVAVPFTATATFSDQSTQNVTRQATFSSSNPSVASIAASGTATAKTSGQTVITATFKESSAQATLQVTSATPLQSLSVTSTQTTLAGGTSQQLRATGSFFDGSSRDLTNSVTWTSLAPSVAQVNGEGLVTALSPGSAQVRASLSGVNGELTLTVTNAVVSFITLTPNSPSIGKGVSQPFTVRATFSDQTIQEVTNDSAFESSSPSIATVSTLAAPRGVATASAVGQTTISANYQGFKADSILTVTPAVLSNLEVFPASSLIAPGRQRRLGLLGVFSDGTRQELSTGIVWSTASGALSVDGQGLVSVPAGTALGTSGTITATRDGLSAQAEIGVGRYAYALGEPGLSGYSLDGAGSISVIETLPSGLFQGTLLTSTSGRYLYANTFAFGSFSPTVYKIANSGELESQGNAFFNSDGNLTFHSNGRWAFMNQPGSITTYEMIADGSLVARHSFTDTGVNFGAMAVDPQREVLFVLAPATGRVRSFAIAGEGNLTPLTSTNPQFSNLPAPATEVYPDSLRGELFGVNPNNGSFSAQTIASDGALSALHSTLSSVLSAALGPNSGRFVTFLTLPSNTLRSATSFSRIPSPQFASVTSLSLGTEVLLDVALSPAEDIIYGLGKTSGTVRSYRFNSGSGNLEATGSSATAPVGTDPLDFSGGALVVTPPADLVN